MNCDYRTIDYRCQDGQLLASADNSATLHACPKCNSLKFLENAKSISERPGPLRGGCACCASNAGPLIYWLSAISMVEECNPREIATLLKSIGSIKTYDQAGSAFELRYDLDGDFVEPAVRNSFRCDVVDPCN